MIDVVVKCDETTSFHGDIQLKSGESLPATKVIIRMGVGCVPEAQVDLRPIGLKITHVDAELFVWLGDRNYRLVDEKNWEVVPAGVVEKARTLAVCAADFTTLSDLAHEILSMTDAHVTK